MDSKVDQPLLEPHQRQPMYSHLETKDYDYNEPKLIEQIEHIELRDADAPVILSGGSGQNETIQVTTAETITAEEKTAKKCKTTKQHTEQPLTMGLNVYDRDEKNINGHVRIMFDDVLAEPDGAHSFVPTWRGTFMFFHWTKRWVYRLLTAILAWPLAFIWGLLFAVLSAVNNHVFTPFSRVFTLVFFWIGQIWRTLFRELVDPVFESVGRSFSGIRLSRGEYSTVGTNTTGKLTNNNGGTGGNPWTYPL